MTQGKLQEQNKDIEFQSKRTVKDAVIAAAGFGTRLLPFTTIVPKELLPIGGVPVAQLLVDECLDAGVENIYVMTRPNSTIIQEHFQGNQNYADFLRTHGNNTQLGFVEGNIKYSNVKFMHANPEIPYGNAQGIFTIRDILSKLTNFLLLWGDDIVLGKSSSIKEIINKYKENECDAVIGVQKMDEIAMRSFGNAKIDDINPEKINDIITKPKTKQDLVSEYAVFGQMVLPGNIFDSFNPLDPNVEPDVTGDALKKLSKTGTVLKSEVTGKWVTIGDPENYLKAMLTWYVQNNKDITPITKIIEENKND